MTNNKIIKYINIMIIVNYAIHKSLPYSPKDIRDCIDGLYDLDGCHISTWSDCWIICDHKYPIEFWSRNKDDYNIFHIEEEWKLIQIYFLVISWYIFINSATHSDSVIDLQSNPDAFYDYLVVFLMGFSEFHRYWSFII